MFSISVIGTCFASYIIPQNSEISNPFPLLAMTMWCSSGFYLHGIYHPNSRTNWDRELPGPQDCTTLGIMWTTSQHVIARAEGPRQSPAASEDPCNRRLPRRSAPRNDHVVFERFLLAWHLPPKLTHELGPGTARFTGLCNSVDHVDHITTCHCEEGRSPDVAVPCRFQKPRNRRLPRACGPRNDSAYRTMDTVGVGVLDDP